MALPIDVSPYELMGITGTDNYLTHYKGRDEREDEFIITEFFPMFMATREESGELLISERFQKEFASDRSEFIRRVEAFQDFRDASLHPMVEVFQRNNTTYMVRRTCGMTTVEQYMGGQQMDYDEAFYFMRPLLISMSQASEKGITFKISLQDFRVNQFKQLVLAAPISWENDFHAPLIMLAKLYYRLLTGIEPASEGTPGFNVYGIEVPQRIETLIMEVLGGDILFGSIDDFYKQMKAFIDGRAEVDTGSSKTFINVLKGVAAVLSVALVASLVMLVLGAVNAYRADSFWANPEIFVDSTPAPVPLYDLSAFTITHPRSSADALIGCFELHDGFIFMRNSGGMLRRRVGEVLFVPGAMGVLAAAEDHIIIQGVRPSAIVGHGSNIFFTDTASDGALYRALVGGGELTRIFDHTVLAPAVVGNFMYFAYGGDNFFLYRMHVETLAMDLVLPMPVFDIIPGGELLFVMAGEPGTDNSGLYVLDFSDYSIRGLVGNVQAGLRMFGETLFFLDGSRRLHSMTPEGVHLAIHSPTNVRSFDVFFQWVVFTEEGRHVPRAYNIETGEFFTLSYTEWASYVWISEGYIFAIDHTNPDRVIELTLPGW